MGQAGERQGAVGEAGRWAGAARRVVADLLGLWVEVARGGLDGEEGWWVSVYRRAGGRVLVLLWVPQRGRVRIISADRAGKVDKDRR